MGSSPGNVRPASVAYPSRVNADDDDDEDGALTLEEFLQECDKSPKSRVSYDKQQHSTRHKTCWYVKTSCLQRKWLIENRVDLDVEKTKKKSGKTTPEPLSTALSPTLGPRSPIVEKDARGGLKKRSKSEMNISKLSYSLSPSLDADTSHLSTSSAARSPQAGASTSTPKYATLGARSPQKAQQVRVTPQQPLNRHLPQTPQLNSTRSNVNGEFAGAGSSPLRSRSAIGFGHEEAQRGAHTSAVESSDSDVRRQNSGSSVGSGSIGSYNARQGAVNTALSPPTAQQNASQFRSHPQTASGPHQRYPSSDSSGDRGFDRSLSRSQTGPRMSGPQPMKANYIPPEHSSGDRYNPDTLRSVTQSYQRNVQQQHPTLSPHNSHKSLNSSTASSLANVTSSPVAHSSPSVQHQQRPYQSPETNRAQHAPNQTSALNKLQYRTGGGPVPDPNPVAPPRRTRPVSAGPLRSGSGGSAFSTPTPASKSMQRSPSNAFEPQRERPHTAHTATRHERPQTAHPAPTPQPRTQPQYAMTSSAQHEQSVRSLPARSDALSRTAGSQPPNRSAHEQNNGDGLAPQTGKKPVWYEYGCV